MTSNDTRTKQRFYNYKKALNQLSKFINKKKLNELEEQGLIKAFEYTYELAWNTLKDFLQYKGQTEIFGSRDAITKSFNLGIIENGELWLDMFKNRNLTSHTYNISIANEIVDLIINKYYLEFVNLNNKLENLLK